MKEAPDAAIPAAKKRRSLLTFPHGLVAGCASAPRASSLPDSRGLVLLVRSYRLPRAALELKNTGTAPVFLYEEHCSWGFFALRAEFSSGSIVFRASRKGSFTVNIPLSAPLVPGASRVFRMILDDRRSVFDSALPESLIGWKVRWRYDTAPAVESGL